MSDRGYKLYKATHEYFGIDPEIIWATLEKDIPEFKKQLKKIQA